MRLSASLMETLLQTSRTFLGGTASVCDISLNYKAWRRPFTSSQTLTAHGAALNTVSTPWRVVSFSLPHILNILYQLMWYALYHVCIFILMHLINLFDGLTILKSLMQLLDNFATLVKPRERFSVFLLRKCLRSSLDIHIYIYIYLYKSFSYGEVRY